MSKVAGKILQILRYWSQNVFKGNRPKHPFLRFFFFFAPKTQIFTRSVKIQLHMPLRACSTQTAVLEQNFSVSKYYYIFLKFKILHTLHFSNNSTFDFSRFIDFFKSYSTIYNYIVCEIFPKNTYIVTYSIITLEKTEKSKKTKRRAI